MDKNLKEMLIKEAEKIGLRLVDKYEHYDNCGKEEFFIDAGMEFDLRDIAESWKTRTKGEEFYFKNSKGESFSLDFLIRNRIIL
ncbi:hypothetical protein PMY12_14775 [Clostridium tertium]|uniref:hypothetical protein n=1 Tax=Clostridium tertium TaxID=1559 RepID=UPI00232FCFBC|nr:hypothetical protein [Clostridium tertium]MDB1931686.1 hypothetical protein [Clostridium tertium]MDB1938268.1 hypothetical protein [Clostridium tertium]MDI9216055.1 hypothetical protein [Clostridium tertium]